MDNYQDVNVIGNDEVEREDKVENALLRRRNSWRQASLALNATRRFRLAVNLQNEEQKEKRKSKITALAQAAAYRFKQMGNDAKKEEEKLFQCVRDKDYNSLLQMGGVDQAAKLLETPLEKGIKEDPDEIDRRRIAYGENSYPRKAVRNFFICFLAACQNTTLIILMICAALSFALKIKTEGIKGGWNDGGIIIFAVILVIFVTAIIDYKQSIHFQNLNEEIKNIQLQVMRGGKILKISIFNLVVGDVVLLKIGDKVPADGILISGQSLSIDESSMTGKSEFVLKYKENPFLMFGCEVADGNGTMLVTGVGLNTKWAVETASISKDNRGETPLQVRLNGFATFIVKVGLSVAIVVLIVLVIRFFTGQTENADGTPQFVKGKTKIGDAINGIVEIFVIAITIVVVAVPEGLPLAVTLTLSYSMRKMIADKALVRRLSACATVGSATTICSNKTGTLTLNQMTIVKACVAGEIKESPESASVAHSYLIEGISQNTTGIVFKLEGGDEVKVTGSQTEKAILLWAVKFGMNFDEEKLKYSILRLFTFNSEKKCSGVALKKLQSPSEVHIHWKGDAEIVLDLCSRWLNSDGSVQEMTPPKKDEFKKIVEEMAAASLRCIAFAYRTDNVQNVPRDEEQLQSWQIPEDDLTLLAIVGIEDPCRSNVKQDVNLCQHDGVKVRMVTGDNIIAATAIARECNILKPEQCLNEPVVIEGRKFRNYTEEQRIHIVDKICVMGGSSPTDKTLLVQALRKRGHVVAVIGDGTNDAPALHEADIGFLMGGIQGTDTAQESSDIIILDDNFASVVKVVRWGHSVYANIQRFIQFQLTVNVAALAINFVAVVSSGNVPLNAVQLLWVNLIMDTLGALALATESPTDDLMHHPPVGHRELLITNRMWRNFIAQVCMQLQLAVNVAALVIKFVAAVSSGNAPLNAMQVLWVNIIVDAIGVLALATESPTDHIIARPPPVQRRERHITNMCRKLLNVFYREPLITNIMWRNLIVQALYQIIVLLTITFKGKDILNLKDGNQIANVDTVRNTIIFNAFVLCQIFNEFNARKPDKINIFQGLQKNLLFIFIIALTIVLQIMIVEFLQKFAKTTQLNLIQWFICIVIGFISWPLAVLSKGARKIIF